MTTYRKRFSQGGRKRSVFVQLSEDEHNTLRHLSIEEKVSMSKYVVDAVLQQMEKDKQKHGLE